MEITLEEIGKGLITVFVIIFILNFTLEDVSYNGEKGLFNILSTIPTTEESDSQIHETPTEVELAESEELPELNLKSYVIRTDVEIRFKSLYTFTLDEVEYDGTNESAGFRSKLKDIYINGQSVYTELKVEQLEESDEIPYSVIYDPEEDVIYFLSPGAYTLVIEVKFTSGAAGTYKVTVPVEPTLNR